METTSMTQQWRATVRYAAPDTITDDQYEALLTGVPGFGIAKRVGTRIQIEMTVDAATALQATTVALREAAAAWKAAFGTTAAPLGASVLDADEHGREIARPPAADLLGIKEVGERLGVTYQRAQQLAKRDDFPEPIAPLAATPVWTGSSVDEFNARWDRKPGRPRKA